MYLLPNKRLLLDAQGAYAVVIMHVANKYVRSRVGCGTRRRPDNPVRTGEVGRPADFTHVASLHSLPTD